MFFIIYETTNLINGKIYRGCHKTDNLDDGYLGSGGNLIKAIKKYGKDNFERTILHYCNSLEEMIAKEAECVNEEFVKRIDTYNQQTGGLSYGVLCTESKKKISDAIKHVKHRDTISESEKIKISNTLKERYANQAHHLKGTEPWNKGMIGAQVAWNKGKVVGPYTDESNAKRSATLKDRYANQEHHLIGTAPWNKGITGAQVAWNKGMPQTKSACPHCNMEVSATNMKRWHGDKCKRFTSVVR